MRSLGGAGLLILLAACRPCSGTTTSLLSAEAAHRAAAPGTPLSDVLRAAAPADIDLDVQITQCGAAMPLRASGGTLLGRREYSGYRGAYSPTGDESDNQYEEWRFQSVAEMADRIHAETLRTNCGRLSLGYYDGCGQHVFRATLKDARVVSIEPVQTWK
jgi:hypothetical protein